jgi:hypothetical protein
MGFNARGKTLELFDRGIIKSPQPNGKDKRNGEREIDLKTKETKLVIAENRERVIIETKRY